MKRYTFLLVFGLVFLGACRKEAAAPECVQSKINVFIDHSCEGANVKQYIFQGQTAFVFEIGACGADLTSDVVDNECKLLGRLGGFIGNTIINGDDFSDAQYVRTVWSR